MYTGIGGLIRVRMYPPPHTMHPPHTMYPPTHTGIGGLVRKHPHCPKEGRRGNQRQCILSYNVSSSSYITAITILEQTLILIEQETRHKKWGGRERGEGEEVGRERNRNCFFFFFDRKCFSFFLTENVSQPFGTFTSLHTVPWPHDLCMCAQGLGFRVQGSGFRVWAQLLTSWHTHNTHTQPSLPCTQCRGHMTCACVHMTRPFFFFFVDVYIYIYYTSLSL